MSTLDLDDTPPSKGHNLSPQERATADQLDSYVDRWNVLEEQMADLREQVKELRAEGKGEGFDMKAVARLAKIRRLSPAKLDKAAEFAGILEVYANALGIEVPLGL